ncbi:hypothetical protein DYQ95_16455 [Xanthomonas sp. LMG 9002]|nr:hypothetical protein [Xanthomonas sp. LMG 9002]
MPHRQHPAAGRQGAAHLGEGTARGQGAGAGAAGAGELRQCRDWGLGIGDSGFGIWDLGFGIREAAAGRVRCCTATAWRYRLRPVALGAAALRCAARPNSRRAHA